jgi:hypothetical protein
MIQEISVFEALPFPRRESVRFKRSIFASVVPVLSLALRPVLELEPLLELPQASELVPLLELPQASELVPLLELPLESELEPSLELPLASEQGRGLSLVKPRVPDRIHWIYT